MLSVGTKESSRVQQILEQRFPNFQPEHEVWHFFSDADIRSRESGYRERQHQRMSEYVERLRNETRNAQLGLDWKVAARPWSRGRAR